MNGLPEVTARQVRDGGLDLELYVHAHSPWFAGHFPQYRILPGVVQIGWAAAFAAHWSGCNTPPTLLERVKFKRPIRPEARLMLRLRTTAGKLHYEYLLVLPEGPVSASSGVLVYPELPA